MIGTVRVGGTVRFIGRVAACLPLSLLASAWLLLRAAHPAPHAHDHGYSWLVAVIVSSAATVFALLQAVSHRSLSSAVALSIPGALAAFFIGGFLFGPV